MRTSVCVYIWGWRDGKSNFCPLEQTKALNKLWTQREDRNVLFFKNLFIYLYCIFPPISHSTTRGLKTFNVSEISLNAPMICTVSPSRIVHVSQSGGFVGGVVGWVMVIIAHEGVPAAWQHAVCIYDALTEHRLVEVRRCVWLYTRKHEEMSWPFFQGFLSRVFRVILSI